jgi:hypothetical protein
MTRPGSPESGSEALGGAGIKLWSAGSPKCGEMPNWIHQVEMVYLKLYKAPGYGMVHYIPLQVWIPFLGVHPSFTWLDLHVGPAWPLFLQLGKVRILTD